MIDPLSIPAAAGVNFAEGDVRHLALGDELSAISISGSTRHLAERDNLIASKVNEVVSQVNNKEQFVNLPTVRTNLPPLSEEVIANYRIAPGFETRVLNAAVSSSPASVGRLEIFYGTGFGATSGDSIVSTLDEFTGETIFHGTGELIVKLTNIGSVTADVVASIILTTRPVSEPFGSLIGAGTQGPTGERGPKGDRGETGGIGKSGPQGTPGMVWRGPWSALNSYATNDGVSFTSGNFTSGYIATSSHTGTAPNVAGAPWNVFASGIIGPTGVTGLTGLSPTFTADVVDGTIYTHGDFVPGPTEDGYQSLSAGTYPFIFNEIVIGGGTDSPSGLAIISASRLAHFRGTTTILLPNEIDSEAAFDYDESATYHSVVAHGSNVPINVLARVSGSRAFDIHVPSPDPAKVSMTFHSFQPLP